MIFLSEQLKENVYHNSILRIGRDFKLLLSHIIPHSITQFKYFFKHKYQPAGSRSSRTPCGPHPEHCPPVRRPRCNDPWPSCFPLRTVRTQNCPAGRAVRRDPIAPTPWFPAPSRAGWPWARICLPTTA